MPFISNLDLEGMGVFGQDNLTSILDHARVLDGISASSADAARHAKATCSKTIAVELETLTALAFAWHSFCSYVVGGKVHLVQ